MAIHAKKSGLMIAGKVVDETKMSWIFKAIDNKGLTIVMKDDEKNRVFDGENAVDEAMKWMGIEWQS